MARAEIFILTTLNTNALSVNSESISTKGDECITGDAKLDHGLGETHRISAWLLCTSEDLHHAQTCPPWAYNPTKTKQFEMG